MGLSNGMISRIETRQWEYGYKVYDDPSDGSVVKMVAQFTVLKAAPHDPATIHVDLKGTTFSPSKKQFVNTSRARAWYQDNIVVRMYFLTFTDHFDLISYGPTTSPESGATTSTVSVSSGVSASAGFFGATGTGNVGVSSSQGTSKSYSETLKDFIVDDKSDISVLHHEYRLNMVEGKKYVHRADLIKNHDDGTLFEPPGLATSNFPIISQGIWQAKRGPDGAYLQIEDTVEFKIEFHQYLSAVYSEKHVDYTVGGAIKGAGKGIENLVSNILDDGSVKIDPGASVDFEYSMNYGHRHVKHTWKQWLHLEKLKTVSVSAVEPDIW